MLILSYLGEISDKYFPCVCVGVCGGENITVISGGLIITLLSILVFTYSSVLHGLDSFLTMKQTVLQCLIKIFL